MIKHIVFFRFKERFNPEERYDNAKELSAIFSPLRSLSSVREYHVGVNISSSENAWDVAIDSTFESAKALEEYRLSPEHQEAILKGKKFDKETSVVDYEF